MSKILVTGGAGYIGTACVKALCDAGHSVAVADNLLTGDRSKVDARARFEPIDVLDRDRLFGFLEANPFDVVVHLAGHKNAGEAMRNPSKYSENIHGVVNVLDGMVKTRVPKILFSSSAFAYGTPERMPIPETHPLNPVNYYGETKAIGERLIQWYSKIHGLNHMIFRFFNVAGDSGLGFDEKNSQNLFPVIRKVVEGKQPALEVFGDDYPTPDGTCVRDYIHVSDIADAHVLAMGLEGSETLNLGTNRGYSVSEVADAFGKALGRGIPRKIVPRRPGDPAELVADAALAKTRLGWMAKRGLREMVESSLF